MGYQYRTQINRVYPTQKRIKQIHVQQKATLFLNSQALPARQWLSLTGLFTATEKASPNGKNSHERFTVLSKTSVEADRNKSQSVSSDRPPSTHKASVVVRYDKSHSGSPHAPSESGHSDFHEIINGGAHTLNLEVSGVWSTNERTLHINNLELRAVVLALKHWERVVIGKTILVASDNSTVVAYINKQGGTVSRSLCMEAKKKLIWCHQREIILRARYIPGKLNALADQLSRRGANSPHRVVPLSQDIQSDMQPVHQAHVGLVCNKIQQETGNLCISNAGPRIRSCRCPVTQLGEHVGLCISTNSPDAPDSDKDTDRGLSDYVNSIRLRKGTVVPDTVVLPQSKSLLMQPRSNIYHKNPKSLDLHAWILSRDQYKQRDSLKTQPDASQNQYEDPLMQYITASQSLYSQNSRYVYHINIFWL